jgi:tetratricopeptide (TPR) repeat protein
MLMVWALCCIAALAGADEPPDWFTPLRDAVYGYTGDAAYMERLGGEVAERAKRELSGTELLNMLSYCEFLIAKAYLAEKNDEQSERHFQQGFDYANSSVKDEPTSMGYRMMAENISQLCTLKSTAWVIANGLKVEQYAKRGLKYDKRNAACSYLIAARWVYAPAPFHNIKKGINEMKEILSGSYDLQKEDYFNVYYSIAYAYNRSKQAGEAKSWLEKALEVYPGNKDALNLGQGKVRIAGSIDSLNAAAE